MKKGGFGNLSHLMSQAFLPRLCIEFFTWQRNWKINLLEKDPLYTAARAVDGESYQS